MSDDRFIVRYIHDHDVHSFRIEAPTTDLRYAFAEAMSNLYMRDLTQVFWSIWQDDKFVAGFNKHGFSMTLPRWQQVEEQVSNSNSEVKHG